MNSVNLVNHLSMNWSQFKDPVSSMCLSGYYFSILVSGGGRFEHCCCNGKYFCH